MFPEALPLKNEPLMGWMTAKAVSYLNCSKSDQRNVVLEEFVASQMFLALVFLIVDILVLVSTQRYYSQSL